MSSQKRGGLLCRVLWIISFVFMPIVDYCAFSSKLPLIRVLKFFLKKIHHNAPYPPYPLFINSRFMQPGRKGG